VVATNARLTKVEATSVAKAAQVACARCIAPSGRASTGTSCSACRAEGSGPTLSWWGLATEAMQEAILRAALLARGVAGLPAARDLDRRAAP